ncbi:unnamed protein product [Closterium sp. Yama58-4]|nr:unnamed protein product [Closterium sp. Yama58-4]
MFQAVSTRDFASKRRSVKLTAAGSTDGRSVRPSPFARASTTRGGSSGEGRRGGKGGKASATDAAAAGASSRSRRKWAQSGGSRAAPSTAEDAVQAELAATPGLLEPMRIELIPEEGKVDCYRIAAGMKSRHPPGVIYELLRDFKRAPAIFRHMDKCSSVPQPDGSLLVVQNVKWRFQLFSGKFDLALYCHCDDATRTITYRLATPGFMKDFVGTSTIRSLSLPHASPSSASSSLPLTVPGTRAISHPQPLLQPELQPQAPQPKPLHPALPIKPVQPRPALQQRLLQLQQAIPLGRFPAQLLAFGRVAVGEPRIEGEGLGGGILGGWPRMGAGAASGAPLAAAAGGAAGAAGAGGAAAAAAAGAGGAVGSMGGGAKIGGVVQWKGGVSAGGASELVKCGPSDCGSEIEIVQRVEPANLPLGPLTQYILGYIITAQMRGLFHDLCVEATNIEARNLAEQERFTNSLPEPASQPKLLPLGGDPHRYSAYHVSTLEADHRHRLHVEPDLGIPLDLLDLSAYCAPPPSQRPPLHPADAKLLRGDNASFKHREGAGAAAGGTRGFTFSKEGAGAAAGGAGALRMKERPTDAGLSWLVHTQYISAAGSGSAPKKRVLNEKEAKLLALQLELADEQMYSTREGQIRYIEESFQAARKPPVHPSNPSLEAVEVLPVLPLFSLAGRQFVHLVFDDTPLADSPAHMHLKEEQKKEMEARAIMKNFKVAAPGGGEPQSFVAYMVPNKRELGRKLRDGESARYDWVREYHWKVRIASYMMFYEWNVLLHT